MKCKMRLGTQRLIDDLMTWINGSFKGALELSLRLLAEQHRVLKLRASAVGLQQITKSMGRQRRVDKSGAVGVRVLASD